MKALRGTEGFTLIELLISVTILGLIMITLFGSLRFGTRVWERSEKHTTRVGDLVRVQALLRREIGQAYPAYLVPAFGKGHVDFKGDAEAMDFIGPAPYALAAAGRARITFRVQSKAEGLALVMTARPELAAEDSHSAQSETLVEGLKNLRFAYFGQAEPSVAAAWHESWENAAHLPVLIRIEADFAGQTVASWPVLTIAPAITADVSCRYDALIRDCEGR